jgi:hypothetical protein
MPGRRSRLNMRPRRTVDAGAAGAQASSELASYFGPPWAPSNEALQRASSCATLSNSPLNAPERLTNVMAAQKEGDRWRGRTCRIRRS